MNFIKSNFWEIDRSPLLYHFGAILSLIHIINYCFWKVQSPFLSGQAQKPLLCWEFVSNCNEASLITSALPPKLFSVYIFLAIFAFVLFIWRRFINISWSLLLGTCLIHLLVYTSDASLKNDIQGLIVFLGLGFLFIPNKIPLIQFSVIVFYFLLGVKELTPEWLSGANLSHHIPFPYKGLEWVTAMGVGMKFTLPFLLVSPIGQRLALSLSGLFLLHAFHFYFERDFTSITMLLILFFFVLEYFIRKKMEFETLYQSYAHPEPSKAWWIVTTLIYLLMQAPFIPKASITDVVKVAGPSAPNECHHISFAYYEHKTIHLENLIADNLDPSIKCHPLVAFNSAKEACNRLETDPEFKTIASYFMSRKISQKKYQTIFTSEDICAESTTYKKLAVKK